MWGLASLKFKQRVNGVIRFRPNQVASVFALKLHPIWIIVYEGGQGTLLTAVTVLWSYNDYTNNVDNGS